MPEQDAHRQQANSEAGCRRSRNQLRVLSASTFAYDVNLVPLRREPSSSTLGEVEVRRHRQHADNDVLVAHDVLPESSGALRGLTKTSAVNRSHAFPQSREQAEADDDK